MSLTECQRIVRREPVSNVVTIKNAETGFSLRVDMDRLN